MTGQTTETPLQGIGISSGVVTGVAYVLRRERRDVPRRILEEREVEGETHRLQRATQRAVADLESAIARCDSQELHRKDDVKAILDVQLRLLQGSRLLRAAACRIRDALINAEAALDDAASELAGIYALIDNAYLSERAVDMRAAAQRVRRHLSRDSGTADLPPNTILVTEELMPADIMLLNPQHVVGIITEMGGKQGHTAILARALRIPAVSGIAGAGSRLVSGQTIALCGDEGTVYVAPSPAQLKRLEERHRRRVSKQISPAAVAAMPSHTADGAEIALEANIELPAEVDSAHAMGALGIGLMRSEFLYMGRDDVPDEEEQYQAFSRMAQVFTAGHVTIRLLDVGADKAPSALKEILPHETNPALGMRGVRLSLRAPSIVLPQLRAVLRANAHYGNVRLLLPMVNCPNDIRAIVQMLAQAHAALLAQNIACAMPKIGAMIEVPAAAINAGALAQLTDFLAIGTNDLLQYTLAVDRGQSDLSALYDQADPALWFLIHHVLQAANAHNTPVSVCGEMAGDPLLLPLLLGVGVRTLSMQPYSIGDVKERLQHLNLEQCKKLAQQAIQKPDAAAVRRLLKKKI